LWLGFWISLRSALGGSIPTSLVIVWLLVREGREAWNAEEDDD